MVAGDEAHASVSVHSPSSDAQILRHDAHSLPLSSSIGHSTWWRELRLTCRATIAAVKLLLQTTKTHKTGKTDSFEVSCGRCADTDVVVTRKNRSTVTPTLAKIIDRHPTHRATSLRRCNLLYSFCSAACDGHRHSLQPRVQDCIRYGSTTHVWRLGIESVERFP